MNDQSLVYLHDHLAGARCAVQLLKDLSNQQTEAAAAALAFRLKDEVQADMNELDKLVAAVGGEGNAPKDVAAWISQKAGRLKLDLKTPLGVFEAIEFLCLGVLGKLAMWDALSASVGQASATIDLDKHKQRAVEQHEVLETLRRSLAKSLFDGWSEAVEFSQGEKALCSWAEGHGIEIKQQAFAIGKAGEFDGETVTLNSTYPPDQRLHYAAHAIGSIVLWEKNKQAAQAIFNELRDAKKRKSVQPERLAEAIKRFRAFETEASQHAVSILRRIGAAWAIPAYTNFMRADLEAITQFHETGRAPVWREFFARWNSEHQTGQRDVAPFDEAAVPAFHAIPIERQEILQQQ